MTKILIAVLLAMIVHLVVLTYKARRLERKNKALDSFLHGHTPTKKEQKQIQNEECILQSTLFGLVCTMRYVGKLSELKSKPKDGDFATDGNEMYFYYNGKWRKVIYDLPQIDYRIRYNH